MNTNVRWVGRVRLWQVVSMLIFLGARLRRRVNRGKLASQKEITGGQKKDEFGGRNMRLQGEIA